MWINLPFILLKLFLLWNVSKDAIMHEELWDSHLSLCAFFKNYKTIVSWIVWYSSPLWLSYRKQGCSLLHLNILSPKIFIMSISTVKLFLFLSFRYYLIYDVECDYGNLFTFTTDCTDILSKGRKLHPITRKLYQSFCNW